MKIFAVARNYDAETESRAFGTGKDPVWFEVPDSAIMHTRQPFFIPDFASDFRACPSVIHRVSRLGKGIAERFAPRYTDAWSIGCLVVGADLLERLRAEGMPWSRALAFDRALMLTGFLPSGTMPCPLRFTIGNGHETITYDTARIRSDFGKTIETLSRDITFKNGDLILTALHPQGLALHEGDRLTTQYEINETTTDTYPTLEINIR